MGNDNLNRLLKAAEALLGKMGGLETPILPQYEDEFIELEILVDELRASSSNKKETQC